MPPAVDADALLLACVRALPSDAALAQLGALGEAAPTLAPVIAAALDLVDREAVALVVAPCGRSVYLVTPPPPLRSAAGAGAGAAAGAPRAPRVLAVQPSACPCAAFGDALAAGGAPMCAHILAVHVALACGAVTARALASDEELVALLT